MPVTLRAFTCGWFQSPLTFFVGGEDRRILRSPVPAYLIEHPRGRILFDTGLGLRFRRDIDSKLGPADTGFEFDESADIAVRLRAADVDPGAIDWIVNSHFHADHCGGNASIPNATVIVQSRELAWAQAAGETRVYDSADFEVGHPIKAIDGELDLFGDGVVRIVPTPGHTPGHQSMIVKLPGGDVLLAADCCYLKQSLDGLVTSPADHDQAQARDTLRRLARLRGQGTRIFFGHDSAFWATLPGDMIIQ
jgi:N-acyl homoserine lactone hydrolase